MLLIIFAGIVTISLGVLCWVNTAKADAGSRYWVGGTGDWSDASHWSATQGGSPGVDVPTSTDDVFIGSGSVTLDASTTVASITITGGDFDTGGNEFAVVDDFIQTGGTVTADPSGTFAVGGSFGVPGPGSAGTFSRFTGSGTSADPYVISDVYGLQAMNGFLSSDFKLNNDIDATSTHNWNWYIYNGNHFVAGFVPIGGSTGYFTDVPTSPFTGAFDGNGKVISGLYMNYDYHAENLLNVKSMGFLGYTGSAASITDVGIENSYMYLYDSAPAGGLVGTNYGTISKAYTYNTSLYSIDYIGGLVGLNDPGGVIADSYSTASINANTSDYIGGLAGFNGGSITDSYARGDVLGNNHVLGGLVGGNYGAWVPDSSGTIENSFATGNITRNGPAHPDYTGGLVGTFNYTGENNGTITNSYFTDSNHDNGLGTLEPGGPSAFFGSRHSHPVYASWDLTNTWDAFDADYPHLKWEHYTPSPPKYITTFNLDGLDPAVNGSITSDDTISLTVPRGTDITALVPTITINGASISPASGIAQNFASPVTYTVTATDSSIQQYTVTVKFSPWPDAFVGNAYAASSTLYATSTDPLDTFAWDVSGAPAWLTVATSSPDAGDTLNFELTGTPGSGDTGQASITFTSTGSDSAIASSITLGFFVDPAAVSLTPASGTLPDVFAGFPYDASSTVAATSTDPLDSFAWDVSGLPGWASVSTSSDGDTLSFEITGTPGSSDVGPVSLAFSATGAGSGATNSASFPFNVNAVPTQTVSGVGLSADTGASAFDFLTDAAAQTITATLSDVLGTDTLYGSVDDGGTWTDITDKVSGTAITWDGATLDGGIHNILFKITDATGRAEETTGSTAYTLDTVPPTVYAGAEPLDQSALFTHDSATSSDNVTAPENLTYAWTQMPGSLGTISFGTPDALVTTMSADIYDNYTAELSVTDQAGNVGTSTFTFHWVPAAGLVVLGVDPAGNAANVPIAAATATVSFSRNITLLDAAKVTITDNASGTVKSGTASVEGGDGASAILSIPYSGLRDGTTYRVNVAQSAVRDASGTVNSPWVSYFSTAASQPTGTLAVTQIDANRTYASPDDTYPGGFAWTFHVTVPNGQNEVQMRFSDFIGNGTSTIPAAGNIRYCSEQSDYSCAADGEWRTLTDNEYGGIVTLTGGADLDGAMPGRQIMVRVEMKVPSSTPGGSYSASYGVQSGTAPA
ncbi:MAG: GLUG motif-containing protein [Bryobacteraceae bacterium]